MRISFSKFNVVTYGEKSDCVYIYVHGLGGSKEDAEEFSKTAERKGFQVLAFDLPGHGERKKDSEKILTPPFSKAADDLITVYDVARSDWKNVYLYAVSLGAYLSLATYQGFEI